MSGEERCPIIYGRMPGARPSRLLQEWVTAGGFGQHCEAVVDVGANFLESKTSG